MISEVLRMLPMIIPINEKLHSINEKKYRKLEEKNAVQGYWEYRKNWEKFPKEHIVEMPLNIDIELTNYCNLKCIMCPATIYKYRNKGYMREELYKKIIDEASLLKVPAVKLIWRGESLLHPKIIEFIKYAKSKGIIDVLLNTNATLLTKEMSEKLINAGLDKLFFSFDSPYKEKYEKIRKGAKYEKVVKNIRDFFEIRTRMESNTPITRVGMVKMDQDEKEMSDFIEMFEPFVDCVAYTDAFYVKENIRDLSNNQYISSEFCCPMPWQRLVISWQGKCYPCCRDEKELYCVGDVNTESINNIWKSEKMNQLRNQHMKGEWNKLEVCRICQNSLKVGKTRKDGMI